ncbi:MAG: ferritin family protein [Sedimentisphaerales bacterium]|nr:ferritin family protein [Sedimentisphaerales bacterium]
MTTKLGVFEIITVAETIERDGVDFYRQAARLFNDKELRKVLFLLADWEHKHEGVFSTMRKELSRCYEESLTFDVSSYLSTSPLALKSLAWSATQSKSKHEFAGNESKEEILELAMNRERSTIRFYCNLLDIVRDSLRRDKINGIIEEEKRHITILRRTLDQLRNPQSNVCGT